MFRKKIAGVANEEAIRNDSGFLADMGRVTYYDIYGDSNSFLS